MEIVVQDRMQSGYRYQRVAVPGEDFDPDFAPEMSPRQMLELGVFEGKYMTDCQSEFPTNWYENARQSEHADPSQNAFGLKSRMPLSHWREKGWIFGPDPRGWFQWYCRYWMGRRLPAVDTAQIKRWRAFSRHRGQIRANCGPMDLDCRPRQRQALLQWAYDPFF